MDRVKWNYNKKHDTFFIDFYYKGVHYYAPNEPPEVGCSSMTIHELTHYIYTVLAKAKVDMEYMP